MREMHLGYPGTSRRHSCACRAGRGHGPGRFGLRIFPSLPRCWRICSGWWPMNPRKARENPATDEGAVEHGVAAVNPAAGTSV